MALDFKPDNEVLMRFAVAINCGNVKKTHLHLASKLRWDSFQKYLDWFQEKKYITCYNTGNTETYVLTKEGKEMFDKLAKFLEYIGNVKNNNFVSN